VSHQLFVGRAAETAVLAGAYDEAAGGHTRIVTVEGLAGVGKTALVRQFLATAMPGVLIAASAAEAEARMPWGVLSQLRGGLSPGWEGLPTADPLTAGRWLTDVLGTPTAAGVTALVMEDLQWIDECSAAALRFALRRLPACPLLVIVTMRPAEMLEAYEGWCRLVDGRGPRLRLQGLAQAELTELADACGAGPLTVPAARRLWRQTRGNPLYVRGLIEEAEPGMLAASAGPLPAPTVLAAQVAARLAACTEPTRVLVRAAAVLGELCPLVIASALAAVASPDAALSEAIAAGLLQEACDAGARHVGFAYPLMRTAVYAMIDPARRAELHALAARLHTGPVALAHQVAAATGPDAGLAAELADLARAESRGGDHASAAEHYLSAASLTARPALRSERAFTACTSWLRCGAVHEISCRRDVIAGLACGPHADLIGGLLALLAGQHDEAVRAWRTCLASVQETPRANLAAAEVATALAGFALLDWDWRAALALPDDGAPLSTLIRRVALAMEGRAATSRGPSALGGSSALEPLARGFDGAWSDDLFAARRCLEAIAGLPGDYGGILRPTAQWLLADVRYRLGALGDATAAAAAALRMLAETARPDGPEATAAHAVAAYAASARGDWQVARGHVEVAAALATPGTSRFQRTYAAAARWSLAVALDDPRQMLGAAEAFEWAFGAPEPAVFPFGPVMAEALVRNGKLADAADWLADYESAARRLGRISAQVAACRVRGVLEEARKDKEAALRAFDEGAPLAARLSQPLETARFMACHGMVLARLGSRSAAADRLARARGMFESIGAVPFAARVAEYLERLPSGVRRRLGVQLTASEQVVARLVASGLSNKEAAKQLRVSPKAVEFHLVNIYGKLGISSRSQLAARGEELGISLGTSCRHCHDDWCRRGDVGV
jgi:DNA-binding CsgD family transcriptional regulator